MAAQHLQLLGRRARADGQRERVVELMDDQIQVDRFLPVDVRIADGQFARVFAIDVDLGLPRTGMESASACFSLQLWTAVANFAGTHIVFWQIPRRSLDVLFAHEKQNIIGLGVVGIGRGLD